MACVGIVVESNLREAIRLIFGSISDRRQKNLVDSIRSSTSSFNFIRFINVFREQNYAADCMAKIGLQSDFGGLYLSDAPDKLLPFLVQDCNGTKFDRLMKS